MDCRVKPGNDGAFSRRMFCVRAMPSQSHEQISEPDLRQMKPAVVFPAAITITFRT
jgi:hypothetical protein